MIRAKKHKINGKEMSEFTVLGDKRHMHILHTTKKKNGQHLSCFSSY